MSFLVRASIFTNCVKRLRRIVLATLFGISLCACGETSNSITSSVAEPATAPQITASLDGKPQTWRLNKRQSDWNAFRSGASIGSANIYGLAIVSADLQRSDTLSIGFSLIETADGFTTDLAEIAVRMQSAGGGRFNSSNDGKASVIIQSAVADGELMHIIGSFSATLPLQPFGSASSDSNVVTVENGSFDVVLPALSR